MAHVRTRRSVVQSASTRPSRDWVNFDSYATHKTPLERRWFARHPRCQLHFPRRAPRRWTSSNAGSSSSPVSRFGGARTAAPALYAPPFATTLPSAMRLRALCLDQGVRHRGRHVGGVLGALRGCQARPEWRRPRWLSSLRTYLQQPTNPVTLRSWRAIDAVLPEIHRGQKASDDSRPCRVHQPAVIRLAAQEDGRH